MQARDRANKYQRTINRLEWLMSLPGMPEREVDLLSKAQGIIRDAWQLATHDYVMNGETE